MSYESEVINIIKKAAPRDNSVDIKATVTRVENGIAWVHIEGGADETPCQMTIDCKKGDTVQVRISNGVAFLVGNGTAPPTDNRVAYIALEAAQQANDNITISREAIIHKVEKEYVASGDSNITKLSSTMYQDEEGVNIYNGTLAEGSSYAHIDGEGFDIREAVGDSVDNANDVVKAEFGEAINLYGGFNNTGKVVISNEEFGVTVSDSLTEDPKQILNINMGTFSEHPGIVSGFLLEGEYDGGIFYDASEIGDFAWYPPILTLPVPPLGSDPTYISSWDGNPYVKVEYSIYYPDLRIVTRIETVEIPTYTDRGREREFTRFNPAEELGLVDGSPETQWYKIRLVDDSVKNKEKIVIQSLNYGSVAIGINSKTLGSNAFAFGEGVIAGSYHGTTYSDMALGRYNEDTPYPPGYLLTVGNGADADHRSNAFTLDESGNVKIGGTLKDLNGNDIYIPEPATDGQAGWALTTDGRGGRNWTAVSSGGISAGVSGTTLIFSAGATVSGTTLIL